MNLQYVRAAAVAKDADADRMLRDAAYLDQVVEAWSILSDMPKEEIMALDITNPKAMQPLIDKMAVKVMGLHFSAMIAHQILMAGRLLPPPSGPRHRSR